MKITENNIRKSLRYLEKLPGEKQERLIEQLLDEQGYLSTFVQQNLEHLFGEEDPVVDFTFNLYYTILYIFKAKQGERYTIVDKKRLVEILEHNHFEHQQDDLGDFIFTQYAAQDFPQDKMLKATGLMKVVVVCLDG